MTSKKNVPRPFFWLTVLLCIKEKFFNPLEHPHRVFFKGYIVQIILWKKLESIPQGILLQLRVTKLFWILDLRFWIKTSLGLQDEDNPSSLNRTITLSLIIQSKIFLLLLLRRGQSKIQNHLIQNRDDTPLSLWRMALITNEEI